ncbi:hypothetical protein TNCV_1543601 [Trichonephila clavipes]|nr:hypothetical protein TNCV_1543601 [Trichonephila clavipes]
MAEKLRKDNNLKHRAFIVKLRSFYDVPNRFRTPSQSLDLNTIVHLWNLPDVRIRDDEAHFWLNGYVNKQNCRIWSEANPQVYVETPLHPEKLTVWCALWAGGILLQKR